MPAPSILPTAPNGLSRGHFLRQAKPKHGFLHTLICKAADMQNSTDAKQWYVDIRNIDSIEKISLDLVRHLEQRVKVGAVLIIHPEPTSILPALKKRWLHLCREVEKQRASTLDKDKKRALSIELSKLRNYTFCCNNRNPDADVVVAPACSRVQYTAPFATLYIASHMSIEQFACLLEKAAMQTVIVLYDDIFKSSPLVFSVLQQLTNTKKPPLYAVAK